MIRKKIWIHVPVFFGAFAHMISWPLSSWGEKVYYNPEAECSETDDNAVFVYCTHGTFDKEGAFQYLVEWLCNTPGALPPNVHSVYLVPYNKRYQGAGIEEFAYQLRDHILANKHRNVILLGHSRGGLVNAFFAEYLAEQADIDVRGVLSLCTPFDGSYLAHYFSQISESVKQMRPGDPFLERLKDEMRQSLIKYLYYVGGWDWIVKPENCCGLEEHQAFVTRFPKEGHLSIMRSIQCANQISAHLWALCRPFLSDEMLAYVIPQAGDLDDFVMINSQRCFQEKETEDGFVLMGKPDLPERIDLDIQQQINLLQEQNDENNTARILLLYRLREKLFQALFDTDSLYSEANSVGEFMLAFFENEKAIPERQTVLQLFPTLSPWEKVINQLISEYKDTPFHEEAAQPDRALGLK